MQKKRLNEEQLKLLKDKINKNGKTIWCPPLNSDFLKEKTNSWFNISTTDNKNPEEFKCILLENKQEIPEKFMKCLKITLKPNKFQREILSQWMRSYICMYNETLKLFKKTFKFNENKQVPKEEKKKVSLSWKTLRSGDLKNIKNQIYEKSGTDEKNKDKIYAHMLDGAIRLATANYKSALTNYKNGNIKHFRLRYWRHNRNIKILDVEPSCFNNGGIRGDYLKKLKAIYKTKNKYRKFDLNKIPTEYKSECKLQFISNLKTWNLFVPTTIKAKNEEKKNELIALDPGVRTFLTGISENHAVKIGTDTESTLKPIFNKIDKLNSGIVNKKKRKILNKYRSKIKNKIDELHWKTINYLTQNFKNILIGDMSVKGITSNKNHLPEMTKRVAYALSFFRFKQRLLYKCLLNGCNYYEVDEKYTSKTCSVCGNVKENLGGNEIYKCSACNSILDRDLNGCRGIYLKSTI